MKRTYNMPTIFVEQVDDIIATSVTNISGNGGISLGGSGHGNVRTPENRNIWE